MHDAVKKLMNGLIVSCQAYEDTPLYGADYMQKMAQCAIMGGCAGIRACWPQDVKAIRDITDLPIIGIHKKMSDANPMDEIFITPDLESASAIIEAGADILALDCTIRPCRSYDQLVALLKSIKNKYPNVAIMADLATLEEGIKAAETGMVDIISTTLSGYTRQSMDHEKDSPNYNLIKELKQLVSIPVNGEGRIWELSHLQGMLDAGADMVTIGSAVTRPHLITERFVKFQTAYQK